MNYLEIIPKELSHLILFHVTDPLELYDLYSSDVIKVILDDPLYWNEKIRYLFPESDDKNVPSNLLDYKNKSIEDKITNYKILLNAYNNTLKIIDPTKDYVGLWSYKVKNITFDLLVPRSAIDFSYNGRIKKIDSQFRNNLFMRFIEAKHILLNVNVGNGYWVYVEMVDRDRKAKRSTYGYKVLIKDAFNILLYIHCVGKHKTIF